MPSSSQQATGKIQTGSSPASFNMPGSQETLKNQLNKKSKKNVVTVCICVCVCVCVYNRINGAWKIAFHV